MKSPVIRIRLYAWYGCVFLALIGTPTWFYALRSSPSLASRPALVGGWLATSMVFVAIGWLLQTTPPDAIRLPPRRSFWIIVLGAIWLHGVTWILFPHGNGPLAPTLPILPPPNTAYATLCRSVAAVVAVVVSLGLLLLCDRQRRSRWHAALFVWHPLTLIAVAMTPWLTPLTGVLGMIYVLLPLAVLTMLRRTAFALALLTNAIGAYLWFWAHY